MNETSPASPRKLHLVGIIAMTTLCVAVTFGLVAWKQNRVFERMQLAALDDDLRTAQSGVLFSLQIDSQGKLVMGLPHTDPRYSQPYSGYYHAAVDADDTTHIKSKSLWDLDMPGLNGALFGNLETAENGSERSFNATDANGKTLRVLATVIPFPGDAKYIVAVSASLDSIQSTTEAYQSEMLTLYIQVGIALSIFFAGVIIITRRRT